MAPSKPYGLVVFGATGFTGTLCCKHLAQHAPADLRWAMAGRSLPKLQTLRAALAEEMPKLIDIPLIEASTDDAPSLERMAAQTRVVLDVVGPYRFHGMPVAKACVRQKADYVDLTGETDYIMSLWEELDEEAKASGVILVPSCGFEAVPADVTTLLAARAAGPGKAALVDVYAEVDKGAISHGTWHSAVHAFANLRGIMAKEADWLKRMGLPPKPSLLSPPRREPEAWGHWTVPFAGCDGWIAARSAALMPGRPFAPGFVMRHYFSFPSLAAPLLMGLALAPVLLAAQLGPTRSLLLALFKPGDGPSEARQREARFRVKAVARDGAGRALARATIAGKEPGYYETSKMISECALLLATRRGELPGPRGGVLTPASAFGDLLVDRLRAVGLAIDVQLP